MAKKGVISLVLILAVLAASVGPLFAPKAKADLFGDAVKQCGGGALAGLVGDYINKGLAALGLGSNIIPVKDEKFQFQECLNRLIDIAIVAARNVLKKKLLDQLVDQTVGWIQGGGEPKFLSNFGDTLEQAVDEGIGDTLREIGLGQFCDSRLKFQLQIAVRKPQTFSQRASCTLSQVVGNIEAFRDDFSRGGFVGLTELSKPQNNRFGLKLMAMEQTLINTEKRKKEQEQETAAGSGYGSTKGCLEWTLLEKANGAPVPAGGTGGWLLVEKNPIVEGDPGFASNLLAGPLLSIDAGVHTGNVDLSKIIWKCTKTEILTPGDVTANLARKATTVDFDAIVNSDDLSAYLAAIGDAIVNRITTESVTGLKGLFKSGAKSPARGGGDNSRFLTADSGIPAAADDYRDNKSGNPPLSPESLAAIKNSLLAEINTAKTNLNQTKTNFQNTSTTNNALILALDNPVPPNQPPKDLIQCAAEKSFITDPASLKAELGNILTYASGTRKAAIAAGLQNADGLLGAATALESGVRSATSSAVLSGISSEVSAFSNQALALVTDSRTILNEAVSLRDKVVENRDACNAN